MGITDMGSDFDRYDKVQRQLGNCRKDGRFGEFARKTILEMGLDAAGPLLSMHKKSESGGGDILILELMLEIAAAKPSDAQSVEMVEAVGRYLKKKKSRKKDISKKGSDTRRFVALKRRHSEIARIMGESESKNMPSPAKMTKWQKKKKAARRTNNC